MKLKLPAVVVAMLKKRGAVVDPKLRTAKSELIKTCLSHNYKPHASVIAFEQNFGTLQIPDGPRMKKDEPYWIFGTHACLTGGGHVDPRGGSKARKLVPVVYTPNDVIYYLDEQGQGYAEDTIEDTSATRYAKDGKALVCRIVLYDALFSRTSTSMELPGLQAEQLSKRLSLKLLKEASDDHLRFFTDKKGDLLVVEDVKKKKTQFAAATAKQFKLVEPPEVPVPVVDKINLSFTKTTELPDTVNLKTLRSLSMRRCPIVKLPDALAGATNLTRLILTECEHLNIDKVLPDIARLSKLKELWLPLSRSLTSLAPLAELPLKSLHLNGVYVQRPDRLPAGIGKLKKLADLRIEFADDISQLPYAEEDVRALRLLFNKKFTDDDIRLSAKKQPKVLYLQAYVKTL